MIGKELQEVIKPGVENCTKFWEIKPFTLAPGTELPAQEDTQSNTTKDKEGNYKDVQYTEEEKFENAEASSSKTCDDIPAKVRRAPSRRTASHNLSELLKSLK